MIEVHTKQVKKITVKILYFLEGFVKFKIEVYMNVC